MISRSTHPVPGPLAGCPLSRGAKNSGALHIHGSTVGVQLGASSSLKVAPFSLVRCGAVSTRCAVSTREELLDTWATDEVRETAPVDCGRLWGIVQKRAADTNADLLALLLVGAGDDV